MYPSTSDPRIDLVPAVDAKFATVGRRNANKARVVRTFLSDNCAGSVRFYFPQGDRSIVVPLASETTSEQVAAKFKADALYLQIGNLHIKPLPRDSSPLAVQSDVLRTLGYDTTGEESRDIGSQPHMRHLFAFFLGRPELQSTARLCNEILVSDCLVRKGRLVHRWLRRKCILYHGTLRVEHEKGEDEVLIIGHYRVDTAETRKGRALRFSDTNGSISFIFDTADTLNLWLTRCQQAEMAPHCDLSDQRLLLLPDQLFSLSHSRLITSLNLRRNSLQMRSSNTPSTSRGPLLGWLDDVARLSHLKSLDVGDNRVGAFPVAFCQIAALTRLNLTSNQIPVLPADVRLLVSLSHLDVSNNWLTELPLQLSECTKLQSLNLAFNRFKKVPDVLPLLTNVSFWQLAGNYIRDLHTIEMANVVKLDLRRNDLESSFRLPTGGNRLLWIDIRDNARVSSVYLTGYPSLQTLHCERLQLTSLNLNGSSLTHLNASHNLLESIVVMPAPYRLSHLDLSHNQLISLPSWLVDLPHIETIIAHHNLLTVLPDRILKTPSLRTLNVHNNRLRELPADVENCQLETLDAHSNLLEALPADLFKAGHRLRTVNVSDNRLRSLPPANALPDLNRIRVLRAGLNDLDESVVAVLVQMRKLKILDLADNNLRFFDDSSLCMLTQLEEVNLASNRLSALSVSLTPLPALRVLRVHSNLITTLPYLSHSQTLQIVDLSNNKLVHASTSHCMSPRLKQLDLTCNPDLDLGTLHSTVPLSEGKSVSLVDIGERASFGRFCIGFSETSGQRNKLCVRQLRPVSRYRTPVCCIVDGGGNADMARQVAARIERFAETEEVRDTNTLKSWILKTHEWLAEAGERICAGCLLVALVDGKVLCASVGSSRGSIFSDGRLQPLLDPFHIDDLEYLRLREANSILDEDNVINGVVRSSRQIGVSFLFPAVIPLPYTSTASLSILDDCIVLATRAVWELLSDSLMIRILSTTSNPQIAAKKIQDAVQSFDHAGNISVMVIRFSWNQSSEQLSATRTPTMCGTSQSHREQISDLTLQKIEERLEKISEVISRIEDETSVDDNRRGDVTQRTSTECASNYGSEFASTHIYSPGASVSGRSTRYQMAPPDPPPSQYRARSREMDELRDRWLSIGRRRGQTKEYSATLQSSLAEPNTLPAPHNRENKTIQL